MTQRYHTIRQNQHDAEFISDHTTNHELIKGTMARTIRTNPDQFTSDTCHHKCRVFVGGLFWREVQCEKKRDKRTNIQTICRYQRQMHVLSGQPSSPGSLSAGIIGQIWAGISPPLFAGFLLLRGPPFGPSRIPPPIGHQAFLNT